MKKSRDKLPRRLWREETTHQPHTPTTLSGHNRRCGFSSSLIVFAGKATLLDLRAPFACATGESAARAVKSRVEEAKESLQAEAGGLVGSVGWQGKQRKNALSGRRD